MLYLNNVHANVCFLINCNNPVIMETRGQTR